MPFPHLTEADHAAFWRDGYVVKRSFFDAEEIGLLQQAIAQDEGIRSHVVALKDSLGGSTELALWNHPGDDLFGAFARCERMVGGAEKLLGGEVYHYHSKLTMKRPRAGGAWDWHQDYGYWYNNGCLYPDMLSVAIAVDRAPKENGCLQMIRGSHKLGRIDHGRVGGQTGADMERVNQALERMPRDYMEMAPGDVCFFHANTLHASEQNKSEHSRNVMLCCYNAAWNDPYKAHHHPGYTRLEKVPDERIKGLGLTLDAGHRAFFDPERDETVEAKTQSDSTAMR